MLNPHDRRDETYGMPSPPNPKRAHTSKVFQDGDTIPGGVCHYTVNTRIMPEGGSAADGSKAQTDLYKAVEMGLTGVASKATPMKLSQLRPAPEIAVVWDGNQCDYVEDHPLLHGSAFLDSRYMDKTFDQSSYYEKDFYDVQGLKPETLDRTIDCEFKLDFPNIKWSQMTSVHAGVRTRHVKDTRANFLFADGHVESKLAKEVVRKLFVCPPPSR
jgi:prepilin-type processing-associated H-X9-DG protein